MAKKKPDAPPMANWWETPAPPLEPCPPPAEPRTVEMAHPSAPPPHPQLTLVQPAASSSNVAPVAPAKPRSDDGMHPTALVFLDDPIARKLAVAWSLGARTGQEMTDDEWLAAAGMAHSIDAKRVARALKANNICRAGGVTDDLAMQYISTIVAEPLAKAARADASSRKGR